MRQKLPAIRYKVIDRCLRSRTHQYWSKEELLQKLAALDLRVGLRTLERDIQDMKYDTLLGFNAPIEYSKSKGGYHYTNPDFSIDLGFGPREYEALAVLIKYITQSWNRLTD